MIQAFRRADSLYESLRVKLGGLDPEATYRVIDVDAPDDTVEMTGKQLMEAGLAIQIKEQPGAKVFTYGKKN